MNDAADTQRIALCVEYDGSSFSGWQAQKSPAVPTVQETLERALGEVANAPVKLICAGRTDAGVHASGQVVHFDTRVKRELKAWVRGGNALLPDTVSVQWSHPVSADFHARFSATARRYRYIICNVRQRPAILNNLVTRHQVPLEAGLMAEAGRYLLGELDFTSYRGVACQSATAMRNVTRLEVSRHGDFVIVDIEANAFLLHMVRNIVGVLLRIGEGIRPPEWALEVLRARDRSAAGVTAPPSGLYLVQVSYPAHFSLPPVQPGPAFAGLLIS